MVSESLGRLLWHITTDSIEDSMRFDWVVPDQVFEFIIELLRTFFWATTPIVPTK